MSEVVFILGAGASKQGGAPTMPEFLDKADELWKLRNTGEYGSSFQNVFEGISALQLVHSKANLDIHNIESIFSAFEMAKILGGLELLGKMDAQLLLDSLIRVITVTLKESLKLEKAPDGNGYVAPKPYPDFAGLLQDFRSTFKPNRTVSVITFNYDVALDYALYRKGLGADYHVTGDPDPRKVSLLKLHGSVNWGQCEECHEIVPVDFANLSQGLRAALAMDRKWVTLDCDSIISTLSHHGKLLPSTPVLVPPTWNKSEYHGALTKVWSRAAKELREAEHIFVIGYSLPDTDSFFRYLYALGVAGGTPLKTFWVHNPDGSLEDRFRSLLGPGAEARFDFHPETFQAAIVRIRTQFQNKH